MPPPPAVLGLAGLAFCMMISGIVLVVVSSTVGKDAAKEHENILVASRSRYLLGQVAGASACDGSNGCDGDCDPIDLASSVPTFAYFHFYNITNPDAVNGGGTPALAEVGPYTCVTAPPVMTARITRTSTTLSSDSSAVSMMYEQTLECDAVRGGDSDLVYLYDKTAAAVTARAVSDWVATLKGTMLSPGDTVGTGGAPAFQSFPAHGNSSIPNNYMRREADDAPVLPVFPHGVVPDGGTRLHSSILPETSLQWHIASIGQTVSFRWKHGLYVRDPVFDEWSYARFVGYLPETDLTSRGSSLFDKSYAYHSCADPASTVTVQLESVSGYDGCASTEGLMLSPDDFILDINLLLGVPAPIIDDGGGGWQAFEIPAFADVAAQSPNCTGGYKDPGVATFAWAWGFFSGVYPYVSHTEVGYDVLGTGASSKWLAEFGVSRKAEGVLPAFAFSMMPKMIAMYAPKGLGGAYPFLFMGKNVDVAALTADALGLDAAPGFLFQDFLVQGKGALFFFRYYSDALKNSLKYAGFYLIIYALVIVLPVAAVRFKVDSDLMR